MKIEAAIAHHTHWTPIEAPADPDGNGDEK